MQCLLIILPMSVAVMTLANEEVPSVNVLDPDDGSALYISPDASQQPVYSLADEEDPLVRLRRSRLRNYLRVGRSTGNLRQYAPVRRSMPTKTIVFIDPLATSEPLFRSQRNNLRNWMRIGKRSSVPSDRIISYAVLAGGEPEKAVLSSL
ncbi:hypothetical protein AAVH_37502 [Aphelenchoides avenae]|nr:hypothetical protein AAVH_37502 [Aphelenchus avenae]